MKKASTYPAVCGSCMDLIDLAAVQAAIRVGRTYVHECGRVLVKGRS